MIKTIMTPLLILLTCVCGAQTIQTKYYDDQWLRKETNEKKAKFSKTVIQNPDGIITTEVKDLKSDEVINSEKYKGDEQMGVWIYRRGNQIENIDYTFKVKYGTSCFNDSVPKINDSIVKNNLKQYADIKIVGYESISDFVSNNIIYPPNARDNDIMGKVYVSFTITSEGNTENVTVVRGVNIALDKEAVRVIRQLKYQSVSSEKSETKIACILIPIIFRLS